MSYPHGFDPTKSIVEFVTLEVIDKAASRAEKRPIYKDVPHVRIRHLGDKTTDYYAPARQKAILPDRSGRRRVNDDEPWLDERPSNGHISYAEAFPLEWARFQSGQEQVRGTPLTMLPSVTPARAAELKHFGVRTVEQLAGLEGRSGLPMGFRFLIDEAKEVLETARSAAAASGIAEQNRLLAEQNAMLMKRLEVLEGGRADARVEVSAPAAASGSEEWADEIEEQLAKWGREQLIEFVRAETGARPRGNPSHVRLVREAAAIARARQLTGEAA